MTLGFQKSKNESDLSNFQSTYERRDQSKCRSARPIKCGRRASVASVMRARVRLSVCSIFYIANISGKKTRNALVLEIEKSNGIFCIGGHSCARSPTRRLQVNELYLVLRNSDIFEEKETTLVDIVKLEYTFPDFFHIRHLCAMRTATDTHSNSTDSEVLRSYRLRRWTSSFFAN